MICDACGSASENESFCPGCGADLSTLAERKASGSPSQDVLPVVDTAAPKCPRHHGLGASATCRRCGRFVCSKCTERALRTETLICPECEALELKQGLPARLRSYGWQLIFSWLAVAGALGTTAIGLTIVLERDATTRFGVLILLGPAVALLLLATALFAVTRRLVFGWTATLMESLLLVPLLVTSPSMCTAALAVAPIFSAVRLLQIKELAARG